MRSNLAPGRVMSSRAPNGSSINSTPAAAPARDEAHACMPPEAGADSTFSRRARQGGRRLDQPRSPAVRAVHLQAEGDVARTVRQGNSAASWKRIRSASRAAQPPAAGRQR
jgi:hypothetical protein